MKNYAMTKLAGEQNAVLNYLILLVRKPIKPFHHFSDFCNLSNSRAPDTHFRLMILKAPYNKYATTSRKAEV